MYDIMFQITYVSVIVAISIQFLCCYANPLIGPNVVRALNRKFEFVVSLSGRSNEATNRPEETHFCGGVLISRRHVLTSAHCKSGHELSDIVVKVGSTDLRTAQEYEIKAWVTHSEWVEFYKIPSFAIDDDISVIKLKKKVRSKIGLAILTNSSKADYTGKQAMTAGWGVTADHGWPRYIRTATVKVISNYECMKNINKADKKHRVGVVQFGMICTNAKPYVVLGCGDSGGPLLINGNEVIGINDSTCPAQGNKYLYLEQNKHVRVDMYMPFIKDMIKKKGFRNFK